MKSIKKISSIITFLILLATMLLQSYNKNLSSPVLKNSNQPVKISVLIGNYNISITSLVKDSLEKIEQENPGTVNYTFYNGKGDQNIQNMQLNSILAEKNIDLIVLDMVDSKYTKYAVEKIKQSNIPAMFWGNVDIPATMSYGKACSIRPDPAEGGILQGSIVVDEWKNDKDKIDKNNDNIIQYIMLEGTPTNIYALERTKYSLLEIQRNNIKTEELATKICNWSEEEADTTISSLLLKYGNKIELIIANDDAMAIGAISALQKYGLNLENNMQDVKVIGFDGIEKARELIKNGVMTGTVVEDPYFIAKTLYTVGLNLLNNQNLIDGTTATIDITGKIVSIPYQGVLVNYK
ncbi:galactose ABC transporter substrate-binding protein [Clostridium chromiireducens]|uniref:galactose ABC transporter substrate-binding protein n=1 Tax=Clostridium chromiireducens TaxID=225345 RepID=UPI003AF5A045